MLHRIVTIYDGTYLYTNLCREANETIILCSFNILFDDFNILSFSVSNIMSNI